jgi:hypothetical protein
MQIRRKQQAAWPEPVSAQDCESRNLDPYLDLQTEIYPVFTRESHLEPSHRHAVARKNLYAAQTNVRLLRINRPIADIPSLPLMTRSRHA